MHSSQRLQTGAYLASNWRRIQDDHFRRCRWLLVTSVAASIHDRHHGTGVAIDAIRHHQIN
jgi:hypothetical protein